MHDMGGPATCKANTKCYQARVCASTVSLFLMCALAVLGHTKPGLAENYRYLSVEVYDRSTRMPVENADVSYQLSSNIDEAGKPTGWVPNYGFGHEKTNGQGSLNYPLTGIGWGNDDSAKIAVRVMVRAAGYEDQAQILWTKETKPEGDAIFYMAKRAANANSNGSGEESKASESYPRELSEWEKKHPMQVNRLSIDNAQAFGAGKARYLKFSYDFYIYKPLSALYLKLEGPGGPFFLPCRDKPSKKWVQTGTGYAEWSPESKLRPSGKYTVYLGGAFGGELYFGTGRPMVEPEIYADWKSSVKNRNAR